MLGITFKENVSDIRNSRVIDIINELKEYDIKVIVCDPLADKEAVQHEYGIELAEYNHNIKADALVIAVAHNVFKKELSIDVLKTHIANNGTKGVVVDVKGIFGKEQFKDAGLLYWRL